VDDGTQFGPLGLGEGAVLRPADERKGLARKHCVRVARTGLDGDDLYLDAGVGEIIVRHRDIHREIAGRVDRLGDKKLTRRSAREVRLRDQRKPRRRGGAEKLSPVHDSLLLIVQRYCPVPFRSTPSSQDTIAYMMTASIERTSTATQTSAIS
jgi:hypothetical protein